MLATFNEYLWSFLTCGAQISYKTNTVGRSVHSCSALPISFENDYCYSLLKLIKYIIMVVRTHGAKSVGARDLLTFNSRRLILPENCESRSEFTVAHVLSLLNRDTEQMYGPEED